MHTHSHTTWLIPTYLYTFILSYQCISSHIYFQTFFKYLLLKLNTPTYIHNINNAHTHIYNINNAHTHTHKQPGLSLHMRGDNKDRNREGRESIGSVSSNGGRYSSDMGGKDNVYLSSNAPPEIKVCACLCV